MMGDTQHVIRHEGRSFWAQISDNRVAQFLLGVAIVFIAAKLAWEGTFSTTFFAVTNQQAPEPYANFHTPIAALLIDTCVLVGIVGFALIKFIFSAVAPLVTGAQAWVEQLAERAAERAASGAAATVATKTAEIVAKDASQPVINYEKLQAVLRDIRKRLDGLETAVGMYNPPVSPTAPVPPASFTSTPVGDNAALEELRRRLDSITVGLQSRTDK